MTRACIVTCTNEIAVYLQIGKLRLPQGVRFAAMRECFDRAGTYEVRLEGEGIPETFDGNPLPHATLTERPDGTVELTGPWKYATPTPADAIPITETQR